MTQILFHPNFVVFPLDQIAHVSPSKNLKLISRATEPNYAAEQKQDLQITKSIDSIIAPYVIGLIGDYV